MPPISLSTNRVIRSKQSFGQDGESHESNTQNASEHKSARITSPKMIHPVKSFLPDAILGFEIQEPCGRDLCIVTVVRQGLTQCNNLRTGKACNGPYDGE